MKKVLLFLFLAAILVVVLFMGFGSDDVLLQPVSSTQLDFAGYFGGSSYDRGQGRAIDANGDIYVAGNTRSNDLQIVGGYDPSFNSPISSENEGQDGFVAKISADGTQLLASTYLGGSTQDRAYGVDVDANGNVYVVGVTDSPDFPKTNQIGNPSSLSGTDTDVFVTKLTSDLSSVVYSTVIGGDFEDWSRGNFFLADDGSVYVGGRTNSGNFPVSADAYQGVHSNPGSNLGDWDAFLFKLNPLGDTLVFSTFLGGAGGDTTNPGVYEVSDGVVVAGMTNSNDFPVTAGAYQTTYGGDSGLSYTGDGFVAKISLDGSSLVWSTYLGGSENDHVAGNDGLLVSDDGSIYVIGDTQSVDFPSTPGAFMTSHNSLNGNPPLDSDFDGFVSHFDSSGNLLESTFIGGTDFEELSGIGVDSFGDIYISGNTLSNDYFTTSDALQGSKTGNIEVIFTGLSPDLSNVFYSTYYSGGSSGTNQRGRGIYILNDKIALSGDTDSSSFSTSGVFQENQAGNGDAFLMLFSKNTAPAPPSGLQASIS